MASDLNWTVVDVDQLSEEARVAYALSKEAYKTYKAAKEEFEEIMQLEFCQHLNGGTELKFGYNFGKLSVAVGPKTAKAKTKPATSLADFLASQSNGGHRS